MEIPALHYMIAAAAAHHPLRRLRDLRHAGAVEQRAEGARGAHRLPAGQSRPDRHRADARQGACGWRSSSRPSPSNTTATLRSAARSAARRRDRPGRSRSSRSYGPRPQGAEAARDADAATRAKTGEGLSQRLGTMALRPRRRRRRHQRRRHRPRRRRPRPARAAVREGRPRRGHLVAQRQAGPWRAALSRILRVPAGARGADRARGAAARRAAHHLADALRAAAQSRAAPGLADPARPLPLRPSRRPQEAAGDPHPRPAARPGGRAAQARVSARPSNIPTAGSTMRGWWC